MNIEGLRRVAAELAAHRNQPGWRSQRRATVADIRLRAGASAQDIAQARGVSKRTVHRWRRATDE